MPTDIEQMMLNMGGKKPTRQTTDNQETQKEPSEEEIQKTQSEKKDEPIDIKETSDEKEIMPKVPDNMDVALDKPENTEVPIDKTSLPSRKKKPRQGSRAEKDTDHISIGAFPKEIFDLAKRAFINYEPGYGEPKVTQKEYLEAYIYAHEDCPSNIKVSKRVRDMAATMKKDDNILQVKDTTIRLAREIQALVDELDILKLLELYDLYDQHGFREGPMQSSADTVNYLRESDKIERMSEAASRDAKKLRAREEEKKHRI